MLCKAILREFGKEKPCWLPADPSSFFGFCRRCHFDKVTSLIDSLRLQLQSDSLPNPEEICILQQEFFLIEALHKGREQAFLSLLDILRKKDRSLFDTIISSLKKKKVFEKLILKSFLCHSFNSRCDLYKTILKQCHYTPRNELEELPGACWRCLAWLFQRSEFYQGSAKVSMNLVRTMDLLTKQKIQLVGLETFQTLFVSLHLNRKEFLARMLLHKLCECLSAEEADVFLQIVFTEGPLLPLTLTKDIERYLPNAQNTDSMKENLYQVALQTLRTRQAKTEEELLAITWHPDWFFRWCIDRKDISWDST